MGDVVGAGEFSQSVSVELSLHGVFRPCVSGLCVLFLLLGPATFMGDVVGAGSLVSQSVLS